MSKIKTFKEFIRESLWSDLQNKSLGQSVRREDDVDGMDKDRFWDYLRETLYKTTSSTYDIKLYTLPYDSILVPISINGMWRSSSVSYLALEGFNDTEGMVVTLDERSWWRLPPYMDEKIREKYFVKYVAETSKRQAYKKIFPKDKRPVTNSFFIEVIDFLLDNIKDGYNALVKKVK